MADDTEDSGAGLALYLEWFKDNAARSITQMLLIQETINPADGKIVPFTILARTISNEAPQRRWTPHRSSDYKTYSQIDANKKFIQNKLLSDALALGLDYVTPHQGMLDALTSGGWQLRNRGLVVAVSQKNVTDLAGGTTTPRTLIDRVDRIRAAQGFPELPRRAGTVT